MIFLAPPEFSSCVRHCLFSFRNPFHEKRKRIKRKRVTNTLPAAHITFQRTSRRADVSPITAVHIAIRRPLKLAAAAPFRRRGRSVRSPTRPHPRGGYAVENPATTSKHEGVSRRTGHSARRQRQHSSSQLHPSSFPSSLRFLGGFLLPRPSPSPSPSGAQARPRWQTRDRVSL